MTEQQQIPFDCAQGRNSRFYKRSKWNIHCFSFSLGWAGSSAVAFSGMGCKMSAQLLALSGGPPIWEVEMSRLIAPLFLLSVVPLWAQFPTVNNQTSQMKGTIEVSVIYPGGGHAQAHLSVQLQQRPGGVMAMSLTDSSGTTEFSQLNAGYYNIKVTGTDIESAESGDFAVEDGRDYQTITVTVKPKESEESGAEIRASASVAAVDLNVPKKAGKEYERASKEMAGENWEKAIDHLNKAIAIDPQYSAAYNDLGVCYGRLSQKDKQREALMKAISVNDHCVPALINLSHMQMKDDQLVDAAATLEKALKAEPSNVDALSLLAQMDLLQHQYELAISVARKVHGLPHHYASVHYTAASALARENRVPEAITELQMFLQEEPDGPRAEMVRKVLVRMQGGRGQANAKSVSPAMGLPVAGVR